MQWPHYIIVPHAFSFHMGRSAHAEPLSLKILWMWNENACGTIGPNAGVTVLIQFHMHFRSTCPSCAKFSLFRPIGTIGR